MALFKRRHEHEADAPAVPSIVADLPTAGAPVAASLSAHSDFVKRVSCSRCGGAKGLPSKTAYLYCDYCGALVDYDFRLANAGTNAALTNTVFHRLVAEVATEMETARVRGDRDAYRAIQLDIFRQWVELCPMAVSPRAKDPEFRDRLVAYLAETTTTKDLDPAQITQNMQMEQLGRALQRTPTADGAWRVAGPFWQMAEMFHKQMQEVYAQFDALGVSAMDPDDPPPGVALRMEYSAFSQGFLPHLSPEDGQRLLDLFGLTAEYKQVEPLETVPHRCGSCGDELVVLPGARVVVCEACGKQLDVESGTITCKGCGADLTFPVGASKVACPYCAAATQRV